jgi:cell division transport system permease protein
MTTMVYLALMAVGSSFFSTLSFDKWKSATRDLVTIHVPDPNQRIESNNNDTRLDAVLKILRTLPNIENITILEKNDIEKLISPLAETDILKNILLPALVEIRINNREVLPNLQSSLKNLAPDIFVENHAELFLLDSKVFFGAEKLFVAIVGLITMVAIISIIFAVFTGLSVNKEVIQVMHLMGAKNGFIARAFQKHVFIVLSFSSIFGACLAAGTFFILDNLFKVAFFGDVEIDLLAQFDLWNWITLIMVPISYPLLGVFVTGISVFILLKNPN